MFRKGYSISGMPTMTLRERIWQQPTRQQNIDMKEALVSTMVSQGLPIETIGLPTE